MFWCFKSSVQTQVYERSYSEHSQGIASPYGTDFNWPWVFFLLPSSHLLRSVSLMSCFPFLSFPFLCFPFLGLNVNRMSTAVVPDPSVDATVQFVLERFSFPFFPSGCDFLHVCVRRHSYASKCFAWADMNYMQEHLWKLNVKFIPCLEPLELQVKREEASLDLMIHRSSSHLFWPLARYLFTMGISPAVGEFSCSLESTAIVMKDQL